MLTEKTDRQIDPDTVDPLLLFVLNFSFQHPVLITHPCQTLSTSRHRLVDLHLCISACTCVCLCVRQFLCGQSGPRSVGTTLSFHRYRSPGTSTDRQADGETVDHKRLSPEVLKPAHSQGATFLHVYGF